MSAFYNHATLRYGGATIQSNTVRGEFEASLGIDLNAVPKVYRPGERIAYAVTLTNSGARDAQGLTLTDDLGALAAGDANRAPLRYVDGSVRYFVNGELRPAPAVTAEAGRPLAFQGVEIPAGGDAALVYAADVTEYAPLGPGALISNIVRLDSDATLGMSVPAQSAANPGANMNVPAQNAANPGANMNAPAQNAANPGANMNAANPGTSMNASAQQAQAPGGFDFGVSPLPIFAREEIRPETQVRLNFSKRLTPQTVSAGEPLTYTLSVENHGATPLHAEDGAVITDVFDPVLEIESVRYNGRPWDASHYSYDRATGVFATLPGQIDVPAASFAQDIATGAWRMTPGMSVIEITGTLR